MSKAKKFFIKVIVLALFTISSFMIFSCMPRNGICTVTFMQDGQPDIIRKVPYGETLTDIPEVKEIVGYNVFWNRTDFSEIKKDIVVIANIYAKKFKLTYEITYSLSSFEKNNIRVHAVPEDSENLSGLKTGRLYQDSLTGEIFQVCVYDAAFKHIIPSDGQYYSFLKWADASTLYERMGGAYYKNINGDEIEDNCIWEFTENKVARAIYISYGHL